METNKARFFKLLGKAVRQPYPKSGKTSARQNAGSSSGKKTRQRKTGASATPLRD